MTRPLKAFLSYAHADADAVRALYDRLVADGVDAWLDKEKLIPGQDWEREIRKAVREADVVVVCLSKQFNQRGYRQKEVRIALDEAEMMPEGEIFIIPARLEECENLESLRKWHWVDLFEKDGYEKLMRSLQYQASKIRTTLSKQDEKKIDGIAPIYPSAYKIMVTGGRRPSSLIQELASLLGQQVVNRGHVLMSNGARGVDEIAAKSAYEVCVDKSFNPLNRIQVFRPKEGIIPNFDFGALKIIEDTYDKRRNYVVDNSDAVIILGGGFGTRDVASYAFSIKKPLIPIGIGMSGEASLEIWKKMINGVIHSSIGVDDLHKIGQHYKKDKKRVAWNAVILAENLI